MAEQRTFSNIAGQSHGRRIAILVIAHGSRSPEANADLHHLVQQLRQRGDFDIVEPAFLEMAEPSIEQGAARCVDEGATDLILLPYFLSPGTHVREDLAAIRDRLQHRFPDIRFLLAEPIGRHPLLVQIISERALQAKQSLKVDP